MQAGPAMGAGSFFAGGRKKAGGATEGFGCCEVRQDNDCLSVRRRIEPSDVRMLLTSVINWPDSPCGTIMAKDHRYTQNPPTNAAGGNRRRKLVKSGYNN